MLISGKVLVDYRIKCFLTLLKSPFIDVERRFNVFERTFNVYERRFYLSINVSFLSWKNCFSRLKFLFYLSFCSNKKEKALKTISFSKLFPYLCLFLLRLRKNEVENNADDGGKTDLGHRKLFCIHSRYSLLVFQTLLIPVE